MTRTRYIPAELRRRILVDAGHRCAIPTCRSLVVDIHHINPWRKTKAHEYENLIALCPNCHRLVSEGKIDQKSLRMYKDNLRYVIDKYSMLEVDVLIALSREQPNSVKPIPPYLDVLFKRILEDGLAELIVTGDALVIGHPEIGAENIKMNPDLLRITDKGKLFVDSISRQKIGYERES